MQQLPRGYYAVAADFENAPKDTFTYKGVTYAVTEGVNLFATAAEADKAATETPDTVLEGLTYESFEAPVILFSAGLHRTDRFYLYASRYLLGQGACVNPNLPMTDKNEGMPANPARDAENETRWRGVHIEYKSQSADLHVVDGVTLETTCFWDSRSNASVPVLRTYFYNIIFGGPCPGHRFRIFSLKEESEARRDILIKDCRHVNMDALGGCGKFLQFAADRVTIDGLCYDNSNALFGFTDALYNEKTYALNTNTEFTIKNSYFRGLTDEAGIAVATQGIGKRTFKLSVENSTFVDAALKGYPVFEPLLESENCSVAMSGCIFVDTRGDGVLVRSRGKGNVTFTDCTFDGFVTEWEVAKPVPTRAPAKIRTGKRDWTTKTADPHRVIGDARADFTALDVRYEGKKAYYGDQHTHTDCGGTSDGEFPMSKTVAKMDELGLDFMFVVDHRQMRGFFLPEWDTDRFVYGTEPGGKITDLKAVRGNACGFHYNMLFRDKHDLALLLANFPEYKFKGDRLTGKFGYPSFTRERFDELVAYIHSIGGMIVHPHPASIMCSDDPTDFSFGEHTYFETLYASPASRDSQQNYKQWCRILDAGLHVYTAGGADCHARPSNAVVSTFYLKERTGTAAFDGMKSGDYTVGGFGMKMCIDGKPMGSRMAYRDGMKLTLRIDDYFAPNMKDNTVYELRVITDKGLAYSSIFSGKEPQALSLEVQDRRFYRAEVFDQTHGYLVAVSNPIWLDL